MGGYTNSVVHCVPKTCDSLNVPCEGGCAEGCFCPVGQVLIGVCTDEAECGQYSYVIVLKWSI